MRQVCPPTTLPSPRFTGIVRPPVVVAMHTNHARRKITKIVLWPLLPNRGQRRLTFTPPARRFNVGKNDLRNSFSHECVSAVQFTLIVNDGSLRPLKKT